MNTWILFIIGFSLGCFSLMALLDDVPVLRAIGCVFIWLMSIGSSLTMIYIIIRGLQVVLQ